MRSRPLLVAARVTAAEKALVEAAAEAEGLPVAEFILRTLMSRAQTSLPDAETVMPAPDSEVGIRSEPGRAEERSA